MNSLQPSLLVQHTGWPFWVSSQPWGLGTGVLTLSPGTVCFCPAQSLEQPGAELHWDASLVPNSKKAMTYLHRRGAEAVAQPCTSLPRSDMKPRQGRGHRSTSYTQTACGVAGLHQSLVVMADDSAQQSGSALLLLCFLLAWPCPAPHHVGMSVCWKQDEACFE